MISSVASFAPRKTVGLSLRSLVAADLPAVEAILLSNRPVFSDDECRTAAEMIRETLEQPPGAEDAYQFLVAEEAGRVVAYACFGTIPLTKGTFDLYWIAVHPGVHSKGVGRELLLACEDEIARQGGRLVVVETSSRKDYDRTRRFYEKTMSYETAAWIKDFYKPGDDKVVYIKRLPLAPALAVENSETATFKCVFPVCGGICCKNGRPPVEPDEQERIQANLWRFLPHLRPSARKHIEKHGWLTHRQKDGNRTIAVEGGWCVFSNEGCTFQKVAMTEGDPWKYKPSACIRFPLEKTKGGTWYIRQWGYRGEAWDLFCLNPQENPTPAAESCRDEIVFSAERERKLAEAPAEEPAAAR